MDVSGSVPPPAVTAQPTGVSPRAYLDLLRNRSFRSLTLAALGASLGDWIGFLAILALTESILGATRAAAFAVSAVMAARVLPSMLLGPIAGVFVDRWDRKRLMIGCHLGRAVVMALIPFSDEVLTLLFATLVIEVLSSLFIPAKDAVLPTLVPSDRLVLANQVNLIVTYASLPVAGVLFAALLGLARPTSAWVPFLAERPVALPIWFNAASFLLAAALLSRLHVPPRPTNGSVDGGPPPGAWQQLREGFSFVAGHPVIRALILGVMLAFGSAGVVISTGQFFASVLDAGSEGFGILIGIVGTGLVAGIVLAAPLSARIVPERLFAPGIAIAGAGLMITALMPSLLWTAPSALLMGAGAGVSLIVGYTILQSRADDHIRGRTFGAFNSGVRVSILLSTTAAPFLVGVIGRERRELIAMPDGSFSVVHPYAIGGVRLTLMLGGALALVGALVAGRSLRRALATEQQLGLSVAEPGEVRRGLFVVFEGGDGSGKTTQIRLLRSAVERLGCAVTVSREPGGTQIGEAVRTVLLAPESAAMADRAEALLYAAARSQHVDEVLAPALARGEVVLCDRYLDSSVVYQGAGRGLGEDVVAELNRWATDGLEPDLVVLLDLDADAGLERVGDTPDRLEAAGSRFHRTVAEAYRRRAAGDPERWLVLDARRPVEDLHAAIRQAVLTRLAQGRLDGRIAGPQPSPDDHVAGGAGVDDEVAVDDEAADDPHLDVELPTVLFDPESSER